MKYLIDYGINIAASFTVLAVLVFISWVLVQRRRQGLISFFGVSKSKRLRLYFSLLRVPQFGAIGADGQPRSFGGSAIPSGELEFLVPYEGLFNYVVPALQEQPGLWRHVFFADVDIVASPAPISANEIEKESSMISFGSPAYNCVSGWIETDLHALGRFIQDNRSIEVANVPAFRDPMHCFVQRVRIGDGPSKAFYVGGMNEPSTQAAAYYLLASWEKLRDRYGDRENFCIVLKGEPNDYTKATILLERRES